jgi:hypothetical protein
MSNFGPPQIFPPVPINEPGAPGSIAAPTTQPNIPTFVPADPGPAFATKTTVPLIPPSPANPVFVPPIVLEVDPNTIPNP